MREELIDITKVLAIRKKRESQPEIYCDKCDHTGKLYRIQDGVVCFDYCDCFIQKKHRDEYPERLKRSRIPYVYWRYEFTDIKNMGTNQEQVKANNRAIQATQNICTQIELFVNSGRNFFIQGQSGTGKTLLACQVGKFAVLKGFDVAFIEYAQFCASMMNFDKPKETSDFIDYAQQSHLLILDGIDQFSVKADLSASLFDQIVATRVMNGKANIFTSNTPLTKLDNKIGVSGISRVKERGTIVSVLGEDFRNNA